MVHRIKIVLTVLTVSLLALLVLGETVAFADEAEIDAVIRPIMEQYDLDESNFSMGYYNTLTGESWYYNGDAAMNGGSVYKLPLNMLYEEKINAGVIRPEDVDIVVYYGDGLASAYRVNTSMEASLVESNNEISEAMRENLAEFPDFRRMQAKYFGIEADALPEAYVTDNVYNARYAVAMLRNLYEHSEEYPIVLGLMKRAQPKDFFRAGITDYDVAHKYGSF